MLSDLAEPSTVCELTVHRGAAGTAPGSVAWRGSVLPQRDAASRLALCRLLCTDTWEERSNEKIMSPEEMVAAVHVGSRVARGSCWRVAWNNDASSEEGVVTSVLDGGRVRVRWVQGGPEFVYSMTPTTQHLRLVPRRPMVQLGRKDAKSLNLSEISMKSTLQRSLPTAKLAEAKVLYGLRCDLAPNWSMKVLRSVARHVEALSLESAQQQHLKAACDCARLSTLHLRGRAVQVGPVVDLTVEVSGTGPSPSTSGGSSNGSAPVAARDPVEEAFDAAPLPARIQELRVTCVIREQLMQLHRLTSLRRLEVHSPFEAPLLNLSFPTAGASGLEWLRVGLYPLTTALALMRAHAGSLRVLELVAASREPYGCPDLADQLSRCGFQVLERIVLWRGSVTEVFCWHEVAECAMQKNTLLVALSNIKVMCSDCDQVEETELN
ncbi:hypothetical protein FOCC_FOCC004035 [Frankliniella occidentalis]|nr:hypothetical protein FOCC_FOCC004035 [Frankliniella occidentalis]